MPHPDTLVRPGPWLALTALSCLAIARPAAAASPIASTAGAESPPSCGFLAGQTIARTRPDLLRGEDIPIDHIVYLMQENRSFDHFFQDLPAAGQPDADVSPPGTPNVDAQGNVVPLTRANSPCIGDPPHTWNAVHAQIDGGKMDGFAAQGGAKAMVHYDANWLPFHYSLASTFAIADRYFASVPGPTYPNRIFALSGTSFGHIAYDVPTPRDQESSVLHQLEEAGQEWFVYSATDPAIEEQIFPQLKLDHADRFRTIDDFYTVAAAGSTTTWRRRPPARRTTSRRS